MAVKWRQIEDDGDRYNLQYRTAGDERVRSEHAALDNTTLPPSDPFWNDYLPPNGWNCRCTVEQVLRDDYPMSDPETARAAGDACTDTPKSRMFRYNAGREMTVFPKNHPYLPKGCGDCNNSTLLNLSWGKGKPECICCKHIFRQLTIEARNTARNELKRNPPKPLKVKDSESNISVGRLYLGKGDRDNLISHCFNPQEVIIARQVEHYIPVMRHVRDEELKDKENTAKKRERGVIRYSVYEFDVTLFERGDRVTRIVEMKCEVIQKGHSRPCEYPYALKIL